MIRWYMRKEYHLSAWKIIQKTNDAKAYELMAIHKLNKYKITWIVIKPNLHLFIIEVINSPKIGSWGVKERVVESMIWRISAQLVQLKPLSNIRMITIVFISLSCENANKKTRTEKCTEYFGICKNDSKSFFVWCGLHVALVVSENYEIQKFVMIAKSWGSNQKIDHIYVWSTKNWMFG